MLLLREVGKKLAVYKEFLVLSILYNFSSLFKHILQNQISLS